MRAMTVVLVILLLALQGKAWFGDSGHVAAAELRRQADVQRARAEELAQRNRLLTAEVLALKDGYAVVEARARRDLGMVRHGETFYLLTDRPVRRDRPDPQ
jgi:cell division protein FtsB